MFYSLLYIYPNIVLCDFFLLPSKDIRVIQKRQIAFVRYKNRVNSEFAKVILTMFQQILTKSINALTYTKDRSSVWQSMSGKITCLMMPETKCAQTDLEDELSK